MIKHDLIKEIGIEKAREIVEGAPELATLIFYFFDEINNELIGPEYYRDNGSQHFDKFRKSWGFCLDPQIRVTKPHGFLVSINDLSTAIAQHGSREFKVGDLVVKTHPKNTILWPVLGVYKNGGVWLDYKGFCWKPPRVRHATPAEIKAGRRIDASHCQHGYDLACLICGFGTENGVRVWHKQLESDHVTDILNHISPNTKVINHG